MQTERMTETTTVLPQMMAEDAMGQVQETTNPTSPQTPPMTGLLPQYAKTPKRGAPRKKREPDLLLAYLLEHGPVLTMDAPTVQALVSRGLAAHRIVNAVSDLKKYYGVAVTSTRTGRTVTGYTFTL